MDSIDFLMSDLETSESSSEEDLDEEISFNLAKSQGVKKMVPGPLLIHDDATIPDGESRMEIPNASMSDNEEELQRIFFLTGLKISFYKLKNSPMIS